MNGHTGSTRPRQTRTSSACKLSATTRAIRSALTVSTAMLALAGSGVAWAGTCSFTSPTTLECDGGFVNTVSTGIDDLTLILGANLATTVTTVGEDGVNMTGLGSEALVNYGAITSYVTTAGVNAVDISSFYSDATVANSGDIAASGALGYDVTTVSAYSVYGNVAVTNQAGGTIAASANVYGGTAYGIHAQSVYGDSTVSNNGDITANAGALFGDATAIGAASASNDFSDLSNGVDASIGAVATVYDGYALAIGAYAAGGNAVTTLTNDGSISADASASYGEAVAIGALTRAGYNGIAVTLNSGDISAQASVGYGGDATAIGAYTYGNVATVVNSGTIVADADADFGQASATGAIAYGFYAAVYNYNDISVSASADFDQAQATGAYAYGYYGASIDNTGTISASATAYDGTASATGVSSYAKIFAGYVTNDNSISAAATGYVADATGVSNYAYYFGPAVTYNYGDIAAVAQADHFATAIGVDNFAFGYDSVVINDGSITAQANSGGAYDSETGYCVGDCAQAYAVGAWVKGVFTYNTYAWLENGSYGDIEASANVHAGYAHAFGALVQGGAPNSATMIENDGTIAASATGDYAFLVSTGAEAYAIYGSATIVNNGDISGTARVDYVGFAYAIGANVSAPGGPKYAPSEAGIANYGDISAQASVDRGYAYAFGVTASAKYAEVDNAADAVISATAMVDTWGLASALAVYNNGGYVADVVNAGTIAAFASSHGTGYYVSLAGATGVYEYTPILGSANVTNYGDIVAEAHSYDGSTFFAGGAGATGIHQFAKYGATVDNFGDITAIAQTSVGVGVAYGVFQDSKYGAYVNNYAGANITAIAVSASLDGDYSGGRVAASGTRMFGAGPGIEYNAGDIVASALVTPAGEASPSPSLAFSYGAWMHMYGDAELINVGGIQAYAGADLGIAYAYGSTISGLYNSTTDNAGDIVAFADADQGNALAVGSHNYALAEQYLGCNEYGCYYATVGGESALHNQAGGLIRADASADGGTAYAYGAVVISAFDSATVNDGAIVANASGVGGDSFAEGSLSNSFYGSASLDNAGSILAHASGAYATAIGAQVLASYGDEDSGYYAASASNSGSITAVADGDYASTAIGLEAIGRYGDGVYVLNSAAGRIIAAAYGDDATATAVLMSSYGDNTLNNHGSITALGDGARIAVAGSAYSSSTILNYGTLTGSIQTGRYGDFIYNAGTWNAIQDTQLGAGDDVVYNEAGGSINLHDASIDLGYSDSGNVFVNRGTIRVAGDNGIDMGAGPATLVPSLNPNAFYNYGTIDFRDGAPDDSLTIVGDFAGDGAIDVDVSALNGSSDVLYIDGSVVDGTVNTINVNLLDLPTTATSQVAMVQVSGDSSAGNFVIGNVNYSPANFLDLDFSLSSQIDASNASNDVFSLGVQVAGLSDPGTLAAAIAPGAQSLMNSQIGTLRQRSGAIDHNDANDVNLWVRAFRNKGAIDPGHVAGNFGQGGHFAFDQDDSGLEVGADFALTEQFSLGVLLAKAEAKQDLRAGNGSDKIKGDTYGLYGTWKSPTGVYLDASARWMGFDATLHSIAGQLKSHGDAESYNLEMGYAWTLSGGGQLIPQVQYTRTKVNNIHSLPQSLASFDPVGGDSSRGRIGLMYSKTFAATAGGTVWTPYGSINAVREFDGKNSYAINGDFFGDTRTEGTSALVELGFSAKTGNLSVYGGLNWQDGGALQSFVGGQLGLRYTFGGSSR